jgi:bacteriocin-like protein
MEARIMTKEIATAPTSKQMHEPLHELTDDELDQVTGGLVVNAIIAVLIGLLLPPPPSTTGCDCN